MKKIAVLLAGCGVYDGSEIHEATFTLLAIAQNGGTYQCFAPDKEQLHVINHMNGQEMSQNRNVLVESARIARGNIQSVDQLNPALYDAIIIPGGFGAAKNLNQWAINGPDGEIDSLVKFAIRAFVESGRIVCGLCMGPTVIAKALEGSGISASLTVGSTIEPSPYDIAAISQGMQSLGARPEMKTKHEITIDYANKIVTAPCYMMEASIDEVYKNVKQAVDAVFQF